MTADSWRQLQALLLPLLAGLGIAAAALPENLRVEAINTRYILKWDWDYEQNPNVTFSVQNCSDLLKQWNTVKGCENITALNCNVSDLRDPYIRYNFRVSVYNSQTDQRSSNVVKFHPTDDPVLGPPTGLNMTVENGDLYIVIEPPEGLKEDFLRNSCTWLYHLEVSTPSEVITMKENSAHFKITAVQASTTYCARAHTTCDSGERPGLHSKDYCLTTDPRSYVREWIIGTVFLGIVVVSVAVYVCLCPLQRYMKHVFYPRSKLPSSIEKFFQNSPKSFIRSPVNMPEEEPTDQCIIIPNSQLDAGVLNS